MYSTSHLFGTRLTGGLKRFLELYYALKKNGIDVDLCSGDPPEVQRDNNVTGYSIVNNVNHKKSFIPAGIRIFAKNLKALYNIKKRNYACVIVFDVPTAIGICIIGIKNIKLFVRQDLRGYKEILLKEKTNSKIYRFIYLWLINLCEAVCCIRANKIILQCEYDLDVLVRRHRYIGDKIRNKSIIQINNVDPSWIVDNSSKYNLIDMDYIKRDNSDSFLVGYVGSFDGKRKGAEIFIDAVIELINKGLALEAILVGDGSLLSLYKDKCRHYSEIKFIGRLKNPIIALRKFDLMVVPSLADSCPNTMMEALYNEVPVIGSNVGGIPEILKNEDSLFEPNAVSLQNKIEYYMDQSNLSDLKSNQIRRKKELQFDWGVVLIDKLMLDRKTSCSGSPYVS